MNELEFMHLSEIDEAEIIELMNNKEVGKLLPLLRGGFTSAHCHAFVRAKQQLWDEHGFGPWAFVIDGKFAGWGGIQPEQGEADFALVLHPDFWGWGRKIFNKIKHQAFGQLNKQSMTILFPPTRTNSRAIMRFGFLEDGEVEIDGEVFKRFRLHRP